MKSGESSAEAPLDHGGEVYHLARRLGLQLKDLLDFSANINPLGYPPGVAGAVQEALAEVVHYPDRRGFALREELARFHSLAGSEVLLGNGSTELIHLLVRALKPKRALIVAPAFSEYERALAQAEVPHAFHFTSEAEGFTLGALPEVQGIDLLFLANPASPSGALLPPDRLLPWLKVLDGAGTWVALDEAFIDFVEEASLKAHIRRFPRLLILRSFTKFFAIPGLRLGYLLAGPEVVAKLAARQDPWSVNTLAQAAGRACLKDLDYIARSRVFTAAARQELAAGLQALPGLQVFPAAANYLLVKITQPGLRAGRLHQLLLARGLIIRNAANFQGLDESYFRVAVRRPEENARLLAALKDVLA
jgi:threonine-phosphate decarboxylase